LVQIDSVVAMFTVRMQLMHQVHGVTSCGVLTCWLMSFSAAKLLAV
jgi:hypothetical protein